MLSESQERMLLVAAEGREDEVFDVFRKWGLDAVTIGAVTGDGLLRVRQHGRTVAEIPNRELADEAPIYNRPHIESSSRAIGRSSARPAPSPAEALIKLMGSADICSKRYIWQQYDYMVRTNTIAGPGADAAVVRIKENGVSVAMSLDGNSRYCILSPREGAMLAVAECCRNLSTVGALPAAATNCLNFGNPERPEIMAQLVDAIEGMSEACRFFETPITGGNVSLYNETLGGGIWPTPVIGIVGLMQTAAPVTRDFKAPGRPIVLLGGIGECGEVRFGGTQYAKAILNELWGLPPALDMDYEKRVHDAMREIVAAGLAESAHDVSDGGLAVAAAECCQGGVGAAIHLESGLSPEFLLFHEGPSRILISTARPEAVVEIAARHRVAAPQAGITMVKGLSIGNRGEMLISVTIDILKAVYEESLEKQLRS
jgi:phosphoribosylformylglycinamidine synthase